MYIPLSRMSRSKGDMSSMMMLTEALSAPVFVLLMKMDIEALPYSYVVGWILMLVYEAPMMVKYLRKGEL